jgi:hypothetical protein
MIKVIFTLIKLIFIMIRVILDFKTLINLIFDLERS